MQIYTHVEIDNLKPCKPASNWIDTAWSGTLLDIMKLPQVTAPDKIWVFSKLGTDRDKRLFAVWCAKQALALVPNPDARSIAAVDIAEKYALGLATSDELADANANAAAAYATAYATAYLAGDAAPFNAAASAAAADAAASAAADAAADAAAYAAAFNAAYLAGDAASAAAYADADAFNAAYLAGDAYAAWNAARTNARKYQVNYIVKLLEGKI